MNWKYVVGWLCWGLTPHSTIFQSYRDGAIASWVINQYFRGVKCLAQGHNTAAVGLEPRTSRSGVRHSTTEPPRSQQYVVNRPHESLSRCKSSLLIKSPKDFFSKKSEKFTKMRIWNFHVCFLSTPEMGCSTLIVGISTSTETESLRKIIQNKTNVAKIWMK